ncbi:DUF6228 family protein [Streptosporangium sp. LJ11]|uniref:DUF6228 family protein n=1 Tax=Streptosporangium sp. LJ11 TaxID=3436927 RepID=UPI003F7B1D7C
MSHPSSDRLTPEVRIPLGPAKTFVRLAHCERPDEDALLVFLVHVEAPGLQAEVDVDTFRGSELADFLDSLVADFTGWEGTRTWESPWADLQLEAVHTGRSVNFGWTLRFPNRTEDPSGIWFATVHTHVAPGEELTNLAREVRSFLYDE